ncbi:MAG: hypothetical protein GY940_42785 [bacterium]|nr:hypothetical protein [bacterium]
MRQFSSYGPIDRDEHYYSPRNALIEKSCHQLLGRNPEKGGHYITVWAPRQCGKTWVMQEAVRKIRESGEFEVAIITMQLAKGIESESDVLDILVRKLQNAFRRSFPAVKAFKELPTLFTAEYFSKPLILVMDEFDALEEIFINRFAGVFRDIFINRTNELDRPGPEKSYLLHGLALIGVRSVLGIGNESGSPFNTQRSINIPNLTFDEVKGLFKSYETESGQQIEAGVVQKLYDGTRGQPGLTCWLGELLTEGFDDYTNDQSKPVTLGQFKRVFAAATKALPNNNILNLISKAKKESNKSLLMEMFKTGEKIEFTFDEPTHNDLYMNCLVDKETNPDGTYYLRFSCPLVQRRIFNYFSNTIFKQMGQLVAPFTPMDDVITDTEINIPNLVRLYQTYLQKNKEWAFKAAPRRGDMRLYEAVYHFNFYSYLSLFLRNEDAQVIPEFPTGNGKIDLIIDYNKNRYGIELKSFTTERDYKISLEQAAKYGKKLNLSEIYLVSFLEDVDDESRKKYETPYADKESNVTVFPVFVATGN